MKRICCRSGSGSVLAYRIVSRKTAGKLSAFYQFKLTSELDKPPLFKGHFWFHSACAFPDKALGGIC